MSRERPVEVRLDFVFKEIKENPDGTFEIVSIPDPEKYDRVKRNGRWLLIDRFTRMAFDEARVMAQVARDFEKLPIRYEPAKLGDQDAWVRGRGEAIAALLEGQGRPPSPDARSHDDLLGTLDADHSFAFVTVFVRNLSGFAQLSNADRAIVVGTLAHEFALAADVHHGSLWRSSQTTFSFFFPAPNLITKVDLSLAFATTARDLIRVVNGFLAARAWPEVVAAIGVEAGAAFAHIAGLSERYTAVDLVGAAVSVSEELARVGADGDVLVGPMAAQLAHGSWQRLMKPMEPQPQVAIPDVAGSQGLIYRLAPDAHGGAAVISGGPGVTAAFVNDPKSPPAEPSK